MKIVKVTRDDEHVRVMWITSDLAAETHDVSWQEAPTPEFDKAFQALTAVAANILELEDENMIVHELAIHRTKHGTKSAVISFRKALSAVDQAHKMSTPQFRFDEPNPSEQGIRQCSPKQAAAIERVMELAQKYAEGERSQTLLPLVTEAAEPEDGDALAFSGAATSKKGKK